MSGNRRLGSHRRTPRRGRLCRGEALEPRIVLSSEDVAALVAQPAATDDLVIEPIAPAPADADHGADGVEITDTHILTATEIIPRFAANPTITALRSGSWSDPTLWSAGRVPTAGDRVLIGQGRSVTYTSLSDVPIDSMEVWGRLIFSPSVDTRMTIGTLTVMPSGTLQIGTAASPIVAQKTAELVIADQPLDLVKDPRQYGTGLIALGKVTIQGAALNQTWTRLSTEPRTGDSVLVLSQTDATWQPGDTLVLPDTRQVPTSKVSQFVNGQFPPRWEEVTIHHIVGNRVFLTAPLQYDHLGARDADGVTKLLPHVALLDRNVTIRSQNPEGTRGHTIYLARADVDIAYARFEDLGRTDAFRDLDNSKFDAQGNVIHVGTNQVGRYAVHFHHVMGPVNPTNTGYQFEFIGNAIVDSKKWALAVHDTSFGLIDKNVVYMAQGAGFVTEDGTESMNTFSNNIAIRIQGTHSDGKTGTDVSDYGRGGTGFWFRRAGNYVVGNVAADTTYAGFVFDSYGDSGPVTLPLFRGADKHQPGQGYTSDFNPAVTMSNNEAYGLTRYGMWCAFITGNNLAPNQPESVFLNFRLWHAYQAGVEMYHTSHVTFRYLTIYGNWSAQDRNDTGSYGLHLRIYENRDTLITGSRIEGVRTGIAAPASDASQAGVERPTVIENSTLRNYVNILVLPPVDNRPGNGTSLEVRNVQFALLAQLPPGPADPLTVAKPANIRMQIAENELVLVQPCVVRVYAYNQVAGDDFQVFFREQRADWVLPKSDFVNTGIIGSPEAGLTNAQNWSKYGIAMGGAIAPESATASRPEIDGLVGPIVDTSAITPRVVLVTPWKGELVTDPLPLKIRYNVVGNLPAGSQVFFQIDNQYPIGSLQNGGVYGIADGWHVLKAWIGGTWFTPWPGTIGTALTFRLATTGAGTSEGATAIIVGDPQSSERELVALGAVGSSLGRGQPTTRDGAQSALPPGASSPQETVRQATTFDFDQPMSGDRLELALWEDLSDVTGSDAFDELLSDLAADGWSATVDS